MLKDPVTVHNLLHAALAVLGIIMAAMITTFIFALREVYLCNRRLQQIMTIGTQLPLVRPLKLQTGTFPVGIYAVVTEIYERPAALNKKKVPRSVAILRIQGFIVAMSPADIKYYFIEELGFHWNYRDWRKIGAPKV